MGRAAQGGISYQQSSFPATRFGLDDWRLETFLPGKRRDEVLAISHRELKHFAAPFFFLDSEGTMVLRTPVNGTTTAGTPYARTELREDRRAYGDWHPEGVHTLSAQLAVSEVPTLANPIRDGSKKSIQKPSVTVAQIVSDEACPCFCHKMKVAYYYLPERKRGALQARLKEPDCTEKSYTLAHYKLGEAFSFSLSLQGNALSIASSGMACALRSDCASFHNFTLASNSSNALM